jgi:hypothetical protein
MAKVWDGFSRNLGVPVSDLLQNSDGTAALQRDRANVFLHHVIDECFSRQVQPRLRGPSTLVRFCDDFVMLFAHEDDAQRVLAVLGKRLGKFGLELHAEKTRLVDFRPNRGPHNGEDATLVAGGTGKHLGATGLMKIHCVDEKSYDFVFELN